MLDFKFHPFFLTVLNYCQQRTVYKMALHLPLALPLEEIKGLTPFDEVTDKIHYLFTKAAAGNAVILYVKQWQCLCPKK